jgi:8-oxo-dGTP pyrophosphatase MutT (NUDIX family)
MKERLRTRNYTAAGGVVVDANGQYVIVLVRPDRAGPDGGPEIRLPKGHVDPTEGRHQAAMREIREETGLQRLQLMAPLGQQTVEFNWKGYHYIRDEYYFLMSASAGGEPHDPEEQFEPRWMPWEEAMNRLTFDAEREWVRRARAAWERVRGYAPPRIEDEEEIQPRDTEGTPANTGMIAQPDEEPPIDIEPEA